MRISRLSTFMQKYAGWLPLLLCAIVPAILRADPLLTAGVTSVGTNAYPYTNKPAAGSQINSSRPLAAGLVSALPVNEGSGTNFYDAVALQSYPALKLAGSPTNALPPAWFTPVVSSDYPWAGAAMSNNGATAQSILSPFQELSLINNVTNGYSYAELMEPLDTNTFGRIMDATGPAVLTTYLNIPGNPGKVATTWRNASDIAVVPYAPFNVGKWILVLCTVQQGLGVMYINGLPVASNTTVNLSNSWGGQVGPLHYNTTGGSDPGTSMCNANFSSWWVWNNRVLSAQEAAQMYANPWSMFHSGSQKGFVKGTKVTVTNPASVSNVWFYSHVAAGNIRLGIYDNNSPMNLLWQSGSISNAAAGNWLAAPISAGAPGTLALAPGTYWLTWEIDTTYDVPSYSPGASGDGFFASQAFGTFPATLAGAQKSSETWSIYLDYGRPVPPLFTGVAFQAAAGTLQLQLEGNTNIPFGLAVSTDLVSWLPLNAMGFASNGLWIFRDTNTGGFPQRFYRAHWP
ncbi:MAG TPA: hypothetical protein VFC44_17115 [Candidatus Saccharimonadales bacterium]|nr:hypothetical protein [Candidatus Saccharimonadales bacterium]